ncbi:hypothetical protein G5I_14441 [Acromyrmex echinatior]|uniref:Uncharacterized protein n=1 Tax=Acromyrmex echinatior TaxID=103372 RepID=F4X7Q7_ACREC|nr:hypothetical protein G5I_14441 [Acromyrmex echinatior]
MKSQSKEVEELPTRSTEKSFEQLLDEEEEDVFDETFMDPNTIRMREAKTMKDALMSFLDALKTRGLLNSMEELNRFFSTSESKVLRHLFMEDFMTRNTFFEWLHDLKEFIRCHMTTLIDALNVDREIFASSGESTSGSMDSLFALTSKQRTDGISQYITKLEHGHLYTVSTPEGQTEH